jgi:metal-responsive CopG/Arc/MetJ family transcriptional regulator
MMRTLVDIPDYLIDELALICDSKRVSRAEIIRQAIVAYIEQNKPAGVDVFGIWKSQGADGVAYQEEVRSEW